eukprot:423796-Prorocentrum_minimum.AAC.1
MCLNVCPLASGVGQRHGAAGAVAVPVPGKDVGQLPGGAEPRTGHLHQRAEPGGRHLSAARRPHARGAARATSPIEGSTRAYSRGRNQSHPRSGPEERTPEPSALRTKSSASRIVTRSSL